MPHYRSITIQRPNGKWYNIRSVFPGSETPVSDRRAEALAIRDGALGTAFEDEKAATNAARLKSRPPSPKRKPRRR